VTLTVTDNLGATGASTSTATPTAAGAGVTTFANDTFNRTVSGGLGTAITGGAYTLSGTPADLSVAPSSAKLALPAGGSAGGYLGSVSSSNVEVTAKLSLSALSNGNGYYAYLTGRRVNATEQYWARIRVLSDGSVRVAVSKLDGSTTETLIGSEVVVTGLTYTPGTVLQFRLQATGTGTTALKAKVWVAANAEPAAWTVSATDSSAGIQAAGSVGFKAYQSGSSTVGTVTQTVTAFTATTPSE
jgi:hypothetical protein